MSDAVITRTYLMSEVERLGPHDFIVVGPAGRPLDAVEVLRPKDGGLEVQVPGRPPIVPALSEAVREALGAHGFTSEAADDRTRPFVCAVGDAGAAVDLVLRVLGEVFGAKPDAALDITHGSRRAEHEAKQKLALVRARLEPLLTQLVGRRPEEDHDADFVLPLGDVHVMVSPRAIPGGPVVVRVFAITNVGVTVSPELGLFLARLNFGLMFGRFALDSEHSAIWFDETLLGEQFSDEELRFAVKVVASTADSWDDRLKQMFGGATYQEVLTGRDTHTPPPVKPGEGGYL